MSTADASSSGIKKLRVLIVDFNEDRRNALRESLRQYGCQVIIAEGEGKALLLDAQKKAMEHFCHVAVIVPRLLRPADPADFSGLELGPQLAPAGIVIYASKPDDAVAYKAGRRQMGYVVRPRDSIQKLVAVIKEQAKRRQLHVDWPQKDYHRTIANTLKIDADRVNPDDLRDLLGRVFPNAIAVELRELPRLQTGELAATPVRRAVVLWARERRTYTNTYLTPKVIKIGTREHIEQEVDHYTQYVESRLLQDRQARLEGHGMLWNVGAIAYAFLGASPESLTPFREFYTQKTAREVLAVLRTLFGEICHNWYYDEREQTPNSSLYLLYDEQMGLTEHLRRFDQESYRLRFEGVAGELPNPALWVQREGHKVTLPEITTCVTHGDLHGDNFFIDQSESAWLIDFEKTGRAHALRDFVELEADIKLRMTRYPADDLPALAALERALLQRRKFTGMLLPTPDILQEPALYKTFQVIAGLRHLAHVVTGITDLQEYRHALLYETLFMATLNQLRESIRRRAALSAALIVDRMTRRTGLLSRDTGLLTLNREQLDGQSRAHAAALLERHQKYLSACYMTAWLQTEPYDGTPPTELTAGLKRIEQETNRLSEIRKTL